MSSADATGRDSETRNAPNDPDRLDLEESQIDVIDGDSLDEAEAAERLADEPGQRLAFGDDDVRLPWLESDDDDDDAATRYSPGQTISLALLALLALGIIGGGIWWANRVKPDDTLLADGGVITAPEQPYKERPKNPGGKTFEGTGDTSFAVSEGQTRPVRLDDTAGRGAAKAAAPVAAAPKAGASGAAAAGAAAAPAADVGGVGVQVAAYSNRAQAEAGWTRLSQQHSGLAGYRHRIVEGQADIGTVYRLQAVAADAGAANALCRNLRSAGLACQVKN